MVRPRGWLAAAAGLAAVLFGLGVAGVLAALLVPSAEPLVVVGSAVIDLVPGWLKSAVIGLFGTGDKVFLLTVLAVVTGALAAFAGALEARWPWAGRGIVLAGAALGVVAAVTRSGASYLSALPAIAAGVVGAWALVFLLRRMPRPQSERIPQSASRRSFLLWAAGSAAVGLVATLGGQLLTRATAAAASARAALRLPKPAATAPPVPAAATLGVPGITPVITPNPKFYRIDVELSVPQLDPAGWSLRVHGLVEHPFTLDFDELLALPLEEHDVTLACVSNEVGGPLISTARWLGYPVRLLLERAGVMSGADMVFSKSSDGWTAATPLSALDDPGRAALLAVGMNGEPLPFEHGFPARLVVPGLYGYVSATKWVVDLEVTRFADRTSYWTQRGWSQQAPVKQSSRIDVPRAGRRLNAGRVWVGGVAWDQHVGISKVEVQLDDGPWQAAQLAQELNTDTWVQWRWPWDAEPGDHQLRVRATNAEGVLQSSAVADVVPDGASGWHAVEVSVAQ